MAKEQKNGVFIDPQARNLFGKGLYTQERDRLIGGTQPFPSPGFCQEFMDRLDEGLRLSEEEHERICDSVDYDAWGYALFGYLENAESIVGDMDLWDWVYFYQAVEKGNLKDAIETITEILE